MADSKRKMNRRAQQKRRRLHPEKTRAAVRKYRASPKGQAAAKRGNSKRRLDKYGLTPETYNALLERQCNKCAICQEVFVRTPHIDHCHDSGKIRGLLCSNCNVGIGYLSKKDILHQAARYLSDE